MLLCRWTHYQTYLSSLQWLGYELDNRGNGVQFQVKARDFYLLYTVQTDCEVHPLVAEDPSPVKAARAWNWPLTSI
jgi:hypothetical protein